MKIVIHRVFFFFFSSNLLIRIGFQWLIFLLHLHVRRETIRTGHYHHKRLLLESLLRLLGIVWFVTVVFFCRSLSADLFRFWCFNDWSDHRARRMSHHLWAARRKRYHGGSGTEGWRRSHVDCSIANCLHAAGEHLLNLCWAQHNGGRRRDWLLRLQHDVFFKNRHGLWSRNGL